MVCRKESASIQSIMRWQYNTICRGGSSLLEQLTQEFPSIQTSDYITFYSLRNHGDLLGKPVTEVEICAKFHLSFQLIYVHSKIMIVDDKGKECF